MAVVALAPVNTAVASNKISVDFRDYHYDTKRSMVCDVIPATTPVQLLAVANTLDAITKCKICYVNRDNVKYAPDAAADAENQGNFAEVSDFVRFRFVSVSNCNADVFVDILGPDVLILAGANQREVDVNNALVQAWSIAMVAVLTNGKVPSQAGGALNDFILVEGTRNRVAREHKQIA